MIKSGIYTLKNIQKDKIYFGYSESMEKAETIIFSDLQKNMFHNKEIQEDYNKGDSIIFEVYKYVIPFKEQLIYERNNLIRKYRENNKNVYNGNPAPDNIFRDKNDLIKLIADIYLKERFNKSLDQLLAHSNKAEIDMYYQIIKNGPEKEELIRLAYKPLIKYQRDEFNRMARNKLNNN